MAVGRLVPLRRCYAFEQRRDEGFLGDRHQRVVPLEAALGMPSLRVAADARRLPAWETSAKTPAHCRRILGTGGGQSPPVKSAAPLRSSWLTPKPHWSDPSGLAPAPLRQL